MAWVKNSLSCGTRDECRQTSNLFNRIEGDLHNLYPALAKLNYDRQAYRFGTVKGEERRYGPKCDFEVSKRYRVAEPRAEIRGEVARAMFYMEHRYNKLSLFKKQADLLLKWHFQDPPSKEEKWRNDKIEMIQGSRNPFVDNPDLIKKRIQK
jgi:deoxyribonuclease-1